MPWRRAEIHLILPSAPYGKMEGIRLGGAPTTTAISWLGVPQLAASGTASMASMQSFTICRRSLFGMECTTFPAAIVLRSSSNRRLVSFVSVLALQPPSHIAARHNGSARALYGG